MRKIGGSTLKSAIGSFNISKNKVDYHLTKFYSKPKIKLGAPQIYQKRLRESYRKESKVN